MDIGTIILIVAIVLGLIIFVKTVRIVPQKEAFIVERLGKYASTLEAGFHILVPFVDRIAYKHTLKEQAIDVPPQQCITKDNIAVEVDGILYMQVVDPSKASYGINNYKFATTQLAQTTMRSAVGKIELDKTFEERDIINSVVVAAVDKASDPWGIKVTRYEVKNILPPQSIKDAMEKQMRAEREKRALIAESEGDRQAKINRADGDRQEAISRSEGEKQKRINEAEGRAFEIERVAQATVRGDPQDRHRHQRQGRPAGRQPPDRRAVPGRVRQAGQDQQHHDHPVGPGQHRRHHQGRLVGPDRAEAGIVRYGRLRGEDRPIIAYFRRSLNIGLSLRMALPRWERAFFSSDSSWATVLLKNGIQKIGSYPKPLSPRGWSRIRPSREPEVSIRTWSGAARHR